MLLKSIELQNFRQFKGKHLIEFSIDSEKNVTIMIGKNGSGKTTLAQAFTWCLYGNVTFIDKILLCKAVSNDMTVGEEVPVKVQINLIHQNRDYTITRKQNYKKDSSGNIKPSGTSMFEIYYKAEDGQQEYVKTIETDLVIKEILPNDLSNYFFFDGEKIEKMSKEIYKGRGNEFGTAVKKLLGLSSYTEALQHLKPNSSHSVFGSYDEEYDSANDSKILEYTNKITSFNTRLEQIEKELNDLDEQEINATDKCEELEKFLRENAESEQMQKEKEKIEKQLEEEKTTKNRFIVDILKDFQINATNYISRKLSLDILQEINEKNEAYNNVPEGIHAKTIEDLKQRGTCICGTKIEIGNEAYIKLNSLLEYIPPQSISTLVSQFKKESEIRAVNSENYFESLTTKYSFIRQLELEQSEKIDMISIYEKKLKDLQNVGRKQEELMQWQRILRECKEKKERLLLEKGSIQTQRDRQETERNELSLKSDKNRKIEICKAYAQYVYNEIQKDYKEQEKNVREKLEKSINEIFNQIYNGGLSLSLNEKYDIQVHVKESGNDRLETSGAQSIIVILAFISGVIKLARENQDKEVSLVATESYPLVMDAPLSAFDKERIENISEVLPKIAEQVIIFIKDIDGEIAEENMKNRIGKKYVFKKDNEYETHLEKGE